MLNPIMILSRTFKEKQTVSELQRDVAGTASSSALKQLSSFRDTHLLEPSLWTLLTPTISRRPSLVR